MSFYILHMKFTKYIQQEKGKDISNLSLKYLYNKGKIEYFHGKHVKIITKLSCNKFTIKK